MLVELDTLHTSKIQLPMHIFNILTLESTKLKAYYSQSTNAELVIDNLHFNLDILVTILQNKLEGAMSF
jgi:hypothetical protein